jgi:hypothetical protein
MPLRDRKTAEARGRSAKVTTRQLESRSTTSHLVTTAFGLVMAAAPRTLRSELELGATGFNLVKGSNRNRAVSVVSPHQIVLTRPKPLGGGPWPPQPHRDAAWTRWIVIIAAVELPQGRQDIREPDRMIHAGDLPQCGTRFNSEHV